MHARILIESCCHHISLFCSSHPLGFVRMGIHLRKVCAKCSCRHVTWSGCLAPLRPICKVCEQIANIKKDKGRCCGLAPTQALQRTKEDATHSGCLAPKKKRKNCKVCEQIANIDKQIAKDKGSGCGLIPTQIKEAAHRPWANGLCCRHAALAGYSRTEKLFEGEKNKNVLPGQTQLPLLKGVVM